MGENLRQILEFCILWFLFAMLVFICVQVVQTNNNETMNPIEEKRKKQPLSIENKHKICKLTKNYKFKKSN
jgi:YbbR domain-containing protein